MLHTFGANVFFSYNGQHRTRPDVNPSTQGTDDLRQILATLKRKPIFTSKIRFYRIDHLLIFRIGKINFLRIHDKYSPEVRSPLIFRHQMKMQMGKLIRISSLVYLCRMKNVIHRTSHTGHVRHKRITPFVTQLKQIIHMLFVGY